MPHLLRLSTYAARLAALSLALGFAEPLGAQSADYYRGTVVNAASTDRPANLELFVFQRSDSQTVGWLKVGAPLHGSGVTAAVARDLDSLYLVTNTSAGDTIVWASSTRTGTLGGEYWIRSGDSAGQTGRWKLQPQPRTSVASLVLLATFIAGVALLAVFAFAVYACEAWWRSRNAMPLAVSDDQARKWKSIGGWLAWTALANSFLVIYLAFTLKDVPQQFGGTWMLAALVPGMRAGLVIEQAGHIFQVVGLVGGLTLLVRKSPLAPAYWLGLLVLLGAYAVYDVTMTGSLLPPLRQLFGEDFVGSFVDEAAKARQINTRLIIGCVVWGIYWTKSRRVRLVFSPTLRRTPNAPAASTRTIAATPSFATQATAGQ